jgi:hypothetical protein
MAPYFDQYSVLATKNASSLWASSKIAVGRLEGFWCSSAEFRGAFECGESTGWETNQGVVVHCSTLCRCSSDWRLQRLLVPRATLVQ